MRKGFTLVELVIALTLLIVLAGAMFSSFAQSFRSWRKIIGRAGERQARLIVAERLCGELRSATLLPACNSGEVFLRLGSKTVSYTLINDKVRRKEGAHSAYLTSEHEIGRLAFAYLPDGRVRVVLDDLDFSVAARN